MYLKVDSDAIFQEFFSNGKHNFYWEEEERSNNFRYLVGSLKVAC